MNSLTITAPPAPLPVVPDGRAPVQPTHASPSLLPAPEPSADYDALGEMYALMAQNRRLGMRQAVHDVKGNRIQQDAIRYQAREALERAREEQEDAGVFGKLGSKLGTVGQIAAVVGAAALIVGTGGAAAPVVILAIAGAAMSTAAFVQSETQFMQEMGMDDKTAFWVQIGLAGGGAVCSGGAGIAAAGGTAASAAQAATTIQKASRVVGAAASIVHGVAGGTSAYANLRAGLCEADAQDHLADAAKERAAEARLERMLKQLLIALEDSEKSDERALGHLRGAIEAKGAALVMASARV